MMEQDVIKQPNKTNRTILIVAGVLVVLCCVCSIVGFFALRSGFNFFTKEMVSEDQATVRQVAQGIMQYDLPSGYQEFMSMNLFGMGEMVLIANDDLGQVIAFVQMTPGIPIDTEQVRQQMQKNMGNSASTNLELVDEWQATIRGQQVNVQQYEGINEDGIPMRQLTTVFDGKSGTIFLMVFGQQSTWNQNDIDDFFASIR
jgi:hypothetical protein